MMDLSDRFETIYIHENSWESEVATRVRTLFPTERIHRVNAKPLAQYEGRLSADEFQATKRRLYITEHPGHFFKRCPGAKRGLACCNYFVLNLGLQCDMNCSYCYLQSYINTPVLTIYSNIDRALAEMREMAETHAELPYRVGTGETIDSLSLDEITLYSKKLIEFFREFPTWTLEFKTKSDRVDQFLDTAHAGNVVVSWSLNPQVVVEREEHGTASLEQRLTAARKCADRGFRLAFHIDPMIWFEGWREHYLGLVNEITSRFKPSDIPYISLGALRFQPEQRHMMRERFGMRSWVTRAEMLPSADGKMRYDQTVRDEMFRTMLQAFRDKSPEWRVFMCMETPESWLRSYDELPARSENLRTLFKALPQHV